MKKEGLYKGSEISLILKTHRLKKYSWQVYFH